MDRDYYYTEQEWAKMVGYGTVPSERQQPVDKHWNGEQQLNKSTGEVEVWSTDGWYSK